MSNMLRAQASHLLVKHYDNIVDSLNHRLDVARAAQDARLVELLEQERQQVTRDAEIFQVARSPFGSSVNRSPFIKVTEWLRSLTQSIATRSDLQVWQQVDAAGDRWWCAYNPQTGRSVVADSDTELRLWIEQNYQGR